MKSLRFMGQRREPSEFLIPMVDYASPLPNVINQVTPV